jgi:1,4-dihydroxy-2-naphthoyl-CoA hydrolase
VKIWKSEFTLEQLNAMNPNTIHQYLGIEFTAFGDSYLEASMPVDGRTHQPQGLLHGGASAVLAESLGSVASLLASDRHTQTCVGIEISASHLKGVKSGTVTGRATPIRLGKSLHVWDIDIRDTFQPGGKPVCRSRLTVMIIDRAEQKKS